MNWLEKRKMKKILLGLSPEKRAKLKKHLETHCIHNVAFSRDIPCLECLGTGNLADVVPFLK